MLYDGALKFLNFAEEAFNLPEDNPRRYEVINVNIQKAQNILAELRGNLNREAGGELAVTLDRLYDYYERRLFEANIKKKVEAIREVSRFIKELRDAWSEMIRKEESIRFQETRGVA